MTPIPTASDLKARYPEFDGVSDAVVNAVIAEVNPMVDDGWEVTDQKAGVLALAAHQLSMEGWPGRLTNGGSVDPANRIVTQRKVGDVQVTYGRVDTTRDGGALSEYSTTVYGKTFLRLLKLNAPAVGLV